MSQNDDIVLGGYVVGGFQQLPWWSHSAETESTWNAVAAAADSWTSADAVVSAWSEQAAATTTVSEQAVVNGSWTTQTPLGNRPL